MAALRGVFLPEVADRWAASVEKLTGTHRVYGKDSGLDGIPEETGFASLGMCKHLFGSALIIFVKQLALPPYNPPILTPCSGHEVFSILRAAGTKPQGQWTFYAKVSHFSPTV